MLDVSRALAQYLAGLLLVARTERGTRRGRRVLGVFSQAVLALRWFRVSTPFARLASDVAISVHLLPLPRTKGIDVLAAQASDLPDVVGERLNSGDSHVILDGIHIPTDRVAEANTEGKTIN